MFFLIVCLSDVICLAVSSNSCQESVLRLIEAIKLTPEARVTRSPASTRSPSPRAGRVMSLGSVKTPSEDYSSEIEVQAPIHPEAPKLP